MIILMWSPSKFMSSYIDVEYFIKWLQHLTVFVDQRTFFFSLANETSTLSITNTTFLSEDKNEWSNFFKTFLFGRKKIIVQFH